jgi:ABC-2 type transport system permease protein
MQAIYALGVKDLRLLFRKRGALFFTLVWPLLVAIMFGFIFGGSGPRPMRLGVAIADDDRSASSQEFVTQFASRAGIDAVRMTRQQALDEVRLGRRVAAIVLQKGFGEAQDRMRAGVFSGASPRIELGIDPSRRNEAGILQSLLFEQATQPLRQMLTATTGAMFDDVTGGGASGSATSSATNGSATNGSRTNGSVAGSRAAKGWQPLDLVRQDVTRASSGPRNGFEITFVQGMLWGIIGCMMSFAVSLVAERTHGTFVRLRMAPVSAAQLLGGKALACFVTLLLMQSLLLIVGMLFFGLRVTSPLLLAAAMLSASTAFVGVMMLIASLGRTEEAASGAGWAIMMPMAMLGGAMIPLIAMPAWMIGVSHVSPIKWAVLALEGAIWRGFTPADMVLPCGILLTVGILSFAAGSRALQRFG